MKLRLGNGLLPLSVLALLLGLVLKFIPVMALRVILGFPFVLFTPGYAVTVMLFPRKADLGGYERIALSAGLSIASVGFIMLVLNSMPWGITQTTIVFSITGFILALTLAAYVRQRTIPQDDRFGVQVTLPGPGSNRAEKALTVVVGVVAVVTLAFAAFVIATPKPKDPFTEFYLPAAELEAGGTVVTHTVGEQTLITVGITNHEGAAQSYRIEVKVDGSLVKTQGPIPLADGEKWEGGMVFSAGKAGHVKVEFFLYKGDSTTPDMDPLRLWIDYS